MSDKQSFKQKTVKGLKWNILNRGLRQVIGLVTSIILARLLSPKEFGLIGMVTVFSGFIMVFVDFGFTSAIIQNKNSDTRHWSSVFWLNLLLSVIFSVLLTLLAPVIANFYDKPILSTVTILIAWTFVFQAFNMVQRTLLKKKLQFKQLAIIGVIAELVGGIVAIIAAYQGLSFWSLIIKLYITILITNIGLWVITKWKPQMTFDKSAIKELLDFTLPLMGTQSLNYWTRNVDYLMIGKVLGDGALGIYAQAYRLMLAPLQNISSVISSVMFPAYSLIQDDKERIKTTYLQITRAIAFITFPVMFGLCVVAEPFILLLLGPKWAEVVPILQILAPLGATQSLGTLNGNIFLSQGATKLQLKVGGVVKVIVITSMMIGLYLGGLKGIALGYFLSSISMAFILYHYMGGLINLSIKEILNNLSRIFFASITMVLIIFIFDMYVSHSWGNMMRLGSLVGIGVGIYGLMVKTLNIKELEAVLKQLKNKE